jgi:hypothetical protein
VPLYASVDVFVDEDLQDIVANSEHANLVRLYTLHPVVTHRDETLRREVTSAADSARAREYAASRILL